MSVGFNTFFTSSGNPKFIIKNIGEKAVNIFGQKVNPGKTYNLIDIPNVSEADIKHSLLKGTLKKKIDGLEIRIIENNLNLVQYDLELIEYFQEAGISTGVRDHDYDEIIIRDLNDMPAAVNGVITLSTNNQIYYVRGMVNLGENRIEITGRNTLLIGRGPRNDGFIGNVSGTLVDAQKGIQIENIFITNSGGRGLKVANEESGRGHCILRTVGFLDCVEAALFSNLTVFSGITLMVKGCDEGITIRDIDHVTITELSSAGNNGDCTALTVPSGAYFHSFQIQQSFFFVEAGQTGLNISNTVSLLDRGLIKDSIFRNGGTPLVGITKGESQWWFDGNTGIIDSTNRGSIGYSVTSPVTIAIDTQNEWVPITGSYTLFEGSERVLLDGYEVVYDGYFDHTFAINCVVNLSTPSGNTTSQLAIAVNGVIDNSTIIEVQAKSSSYETYVIHGFADVSQGDTISIWIRNTASTADYEVKSSRITIV